MKIIISQIKSRFFEYLRKSKETNLKEELALLGIRNYKINPDFSIDVDDQVILAHKELTKIPVKFRHVSGSFMCQHNKLKSLENAPESVGKDFICSHNKLKSLKFGPKAVLGDYNCGSNKIESFKDGPDFIKGHFIVVNNNLKDLKHFPKEVQGPVYLGQNPVKTLDTLTDCKAPKAIHIGSDAQLKSIMDGRFPKEELEIIIKNNTIKEQAQNLEIELLVKKETNKTKKMKL